MGARQVMTHVQEVEAQRALRDRLERMREAVGPFLPAGATFESVLWGALTSAMANPDLYAVSAKSMMLAVVQAAQTGLAVGQSVFLVPFRGACSMVVHYRGYVELALASGLVRSVFAHEVREGEHFEVHAGTEPRIVHHVSLACRHNPIVGAYAVAYLPGGGVVTEIMDAKEIDQVRNVYSQKWNAGKVGALPAWYARKTPVRRLAKFLPQSRALFLAQHYDESRALLRPEEVDAAMAAQCVGAIDGAPLALAASGVQGIGEGAAHTKVRLSVPLAAHVRPAERSAAMPAALPATAAVLGVPKAGPGGARVAAAAVLPFEAPAGSAPRDLPPALVAHEDDPDGLPF